MKADIVRLLKSNNDFISGEDISQKFGVSRSAIWKYMNILREEGYEIESVPRRGYRLIHSPDILTLEEIEEYLNTDFIGRNILYYNSLSSTNTEAKEVAKKVEEGTIVVAEEQTKGRGRLGRGWVSPKGKGIWMSLILKPKMSPLKVAKITLIGAAAVNLALKDMGIRSYIKWPNDIIIDNRKVSGILTEMNCELNMISHVIMGMGINIGLDKRDLSNQLADKAISLREVVGGRVDRKKLLAYVLNRFEELYIPFIRDGDISRTIEISRQASNLTGKDVRIIGSHTEKIGRVLTIDDEGQLVVEYDDGNIEKIFSGEVSIRGLRGYMDN
ncbi:MAG TPA: biotin--[acetyl-CoA-carboxylase] ligase [Tepidimicrobium sp.]|nr:biotin--[acetyl-CoA-carboxylase] ligase [Tepidimicrobium sp.]